MIRRLAVLVALAAFALLALAAPASAHVRIPWSTAGATTSTTEAERTTTTDALPDTTLEADQRDDGATSMAPWIVGSGIAAVLVVAIGGLILKRQQDRGIERDRAAASGDQPAAPER